MINERDVIFDWDYSGFHAWYKAWIYIAIEMKKKDGTKKKIVLMEGERRGNISGEGQEAVSLKNCTEYSFITQGKNYDSDTRLFGTLKVKPKEGKDPRSKVKEADGISAT